MLFSCKVLLLTWNFTSWKLLCLPLLLRLQSQSCHFWDCHVKGFSPALGVSQVPCHFTGGSRQMYCVSNRYLFYFAATMWITKCSKPQDCWAGCPADLSLAAMNVDTLCNCTKFKHFLIFRGANHRNPIGLVLVQAHSILLSKNYKGFYSLTFMSEVYVAFLHLNLLYHFWLDTFPKLLSNEICLWLKSHVQSLKK